MIQHDPAQVVHPSCPHEMTSFLPIVTLIGSELFGDVCSQIVLSG